MAGLSETLNIVKISHFVLNNAMFCKMFLKNVQHLVGGLVLLFVVQVHLFNHLALSRNAHL